MRRDNGALITRNRMRVDIIAEFFVRVGASKAAVAAAAQTLGRRTLQEDGIRSLLEGKFASSMRMVAAQMTLEEMHEQRRDYANQVRDLAVRGARRQRPGAGERRYRRPRSNEPWNSSIRRMPSTRKALPSSPNRSRRAARCATRSSSARWSISAAKIWKRKRKSSRSIARPNTRGSSRSARSSSGARCNGPNLPRNGRCASRKSEEAQLFLARGGREGAAGAAARNHPGAHQERGRYPAARNRPPPGFGRSRAQDPRADRARTDQPRTAIGDGPDRDGNANSANWRLAGRRRSKFWSSTGKSRFPKKRSP